ncbi:uncharacterized protein LOC144451488 [Glandiceps talaboti]
MKLVALLLVACVAVYSAPNPRNLDYVQMVSDKVELIKHHLRLAKRSSPSRDSHLTAVLDYSRALRNAFPDHKRVARHVPPPLPVVPVLPEFIFDIGPTVEEDSTAAMPDPHVTINLVLDEMRRLMESPMGEVMREQGFMVDLVEVLRDVIGDVREIFDEIREAMMPTEEAEAEEEEGQEEEEQEPEEQEQEEQEQEEEGQEEEEEEPEA